MPEFCALLLIPIFLAKFKKLKLLLLMHFLIFKKITIEKCMFPFALMHFLKIESVKVCYALSKSVAREAVLQ